MGKGRWESGVEEGRQLIYLSLSLWIVPVFYVNPSLRQAQGGSSDKLVVVSQWDRGSRK